MQVNKLPNVVILGGVIAYLFLYIPLIILVLYSFNDSRLGIGWAGFSLHWYKVLFADKVLIKAAVNSLLIAFSASVVSVVLGSLTGIALHRYKLRLLSLLVLLPIATPELLVGVSLLLFYLLINFTLGNFSIMLAHVSFSISFVAIAVNTRMHGMDDSIIDAARDLGATPLKAFFLVLVPIILPGIIAGGLMAFTLSIDDFVITFFTAGVGSSTLPLAIYSMIKMGVTPEVNAASTMIIVITLIMATIVSKISPQLLGSNS